MLCRAIAEVGQLTDHKPLFFIFFILFCCFCIYLSSTELHFPTGALNFINRTQQVSSWNEYNIHTCVFLIFLLIRYVETINHPKPIVLLLSKECLTRESTFFQTSQCSCFLKFGGGGGVCICVLLCFHALALRDPSRPGFPEKHVGKAELGASLPTAHSGATAVVLATWPILAPGALRPREVKK